MQPFSKWLKDPEKGFYIREVWDDEKDRMVYKPDGKLYLRPIQERVLDYALQMDEDGYFKYTTILYSTIKKSGKTTLAAAVVAWYADQAPPGTEIYVLANSLEHAEGRVMKDVKYHMENIPGVKTTAYRIDLPNGTFIQALGQAYKSIAGSRHALTVWDELWGSMSENDQRVWDEMTPIPTVPNSLRFVATYAGFINDSKLLWDLYLKGVGTDENEKGEGQRIEELKDLPCWENGQIFTFWDTERRMPWQTDDYYLQQEKELRPAAFLRLHMNQWVTTHEEFIPVSWWDEAAEAYEGNADLWEDHPFRHWPLYIAVDAGVKRDCTAIVAVGYDAQRTKLGVALHKIWKPKEGEWFDLDATVEKWLRDIYNRYTVASIVYDRTQLHQTMTRLHYAGLPVKEFSQAGKMVAASQLLYDLFKDKKVEAYPDDEFRKHVQMARAQTTALGFKISKSRKDRAHQHHDDAAVALAMAAHEAITQGGADVSIPVVMQSPFSDMNILDNQEEAWLPFPLRSDN